MNSLKILASGMLTGVGFNAEATCAAVRCGIAKFQDSAVLDNNGEFIPYSVIDVVGFETAADRLAWLGAAAVAECLRKLAAAQPSEIMLIACVSEKERPGSISDLGDMHDRISKLLNLRFHRDSTTIAAGRTSIADAMALGRSNQRTDISIIIGVDSYVHPPTMLDYLRRRRLLTTDNSNGFIPGEAAAAIAISASNRDASRLHCFGSHHGMGVREIESDGRITGIVTAAVIKKALAESSLSFDQVDLLVTDASGEQNRFKDTALSITRLARKRSEPIEIWNPADSIGEVGAAIGPLAIGIVHRAAEKDYAPGRFAICQFKDDNGKSAAVLLGTEGALSGK